ncbi:MAG: histidine phosphatase family protein, partial [Sphingomonas sp.]
MASTAILVRHAPHADVGRRLSGRLPGLMLSDEGRGLAVRLGERLRGRALSTVQASPIERTMETANAVAEPMGLAVEPVEALTEIDFGEWTGSSFDELDGDPRWHEWNERRAEGCCPGGERMADAQQRVVEHLFSAARDDLGAIVMVTHCDIIRAAVAYVLG